MTTFTVSTIIIAITAITFIIIALRSTSKPSTTPAIEAEYYYYVVNGKYDMKRIMESAHQYKRGTEGCDLARALRATWASAQVEMTRYNRNKCNTI